MPQVGRRIDAVNLKLQRIGKSVLHMPSQARIEPSGYIKVLTRQDA